MKVIVVCNNSYAIILIQPTKNVKMYMSRLMALCSRANVTIVRRKHTLPDGVWPTMITPFVDNKVKSVDWVALDSKCTICAAGPDEY